MNVSSLIYKRNMAFTSVRDNLWLLWTTAVVLEVLTRSSAAPVFGETNKAMTYLAQYGYLSSSVINPSSGHIVDESSWRKAISEFQSLAGLDNTGIRRQYNYVYTWTANNWNTTPIGELDEETISLMSLPRCGVKDEVGFGESRAKRYALQGSRWSGKDLTYKISKYTTQLNREVVDAVIAKAFSLWSEYTDLTFTQKSAGPVDIEIRFVKGEHDDNDPFDGPGGSVSHAYFPEHGSNFHFDDSEMWTINTGEGFDLFQVAVHEIGHVLGLKHSDVRSAVMTRFYRYNPDFQLHRDDILGIQALYGHRTQTDVGGGVASNPSVSRVTTQALGCSSAPCGTVER